MDQTRVALLRDLLAGTGWVDRTREFGRGLRRSTSNEEGLLLVGTPEDEPWHLAAHLDDESRYSGLPGLSPTLVRWDPPPGAPAHLSVGLQRLEAARRGETLFVVAQDAAPVPLLERVDDARRVGATVFALDCGDGELSGLAHESLVVPAEGITAPGEPSGLALPVWRDLGRVDLETPAVSFDVVQHLVSSAAGDVERVTIGADGQARRGFRDRLARLLDGLQGGPADRD